MFRSLPSHCGAWRRKGLSGAAWRSHASVVFMNTYMSPQIVPAGWLEWVHNGELRCLRCLMRSTTRRPRRESRRTRFVCQATDCRPSGQLNIKKFLAGDDAWNPTRLH